MNKWLENDSVKNSLLISCKLKTMGSFIELIHLIFCLLLFPLSLAFPNIIDISSGSYFLMSEVYMILVILASSKNSGLI